MRLVSASASRRRGGSLYWGALVDASMYGYAQPSVGNMASIAAYEAVAGKKLSVVHWGSSWKNIDGSTNNFNPTYWNNARNRSIIPWFSWHPQQSGQGATQPAYTLAAITRGDWDSYITTWATAAKSWGYPFFLRFMHEPNGNWYPWGINANGNVRADYVPAWQHVHDIFTSVGANNVTWVWCMNNSATVNLTGLYPGDPYVDWVAFDAYYDLHGTTKAAVYQSTYDEIYTLCSATKPCLIGETGAFDGTNGAAHLSEMTSAFGPGTSMPNVRCLLYYNMTDDTKTWPIDSPPSPNTQKRDAWRAGVGQVKYLTSDNNGYLALPQGGKVPVPS